MSDDITSSIVTSSFSIGIYIIYKLLKRYKMRSQCSQNTLHITIKDLHDKIDQQNEIIKQIISTTNDTKINIPDDEKIS
jgi:hypothetical protein